jgi:catechol 2,3-dioxygenase-like lactoylglutathione lyase family enzyme
VRGFALNVSDLPRAVATFRGLDFAYDGEQESSGAALDTLLREPGAHLRTALLHLGAERVELRQVLAPRGRSIPPDSRSNDEIFQHMAIVVSDMDAAFERVKALGLETVSPAPQTIPTSNPAAGGIRALYFRDPDRHALELIWFPKGKGKARWQTGAGTFLGIDHSAIAVARTDRSEQFYEGLGFHVAGRSLNSGVEQEALSGVPGARVRITGLSPNEGPSVEFLSYLSPGPGRPFPPDSAPSDDWHWEITVQVEDVDRALAKAELSGGHRRSPGVVDVTALRLGYSRAALVTDDDGHALRLVQQ